MTYYLLPTADPYDDLSRNIYLVNLVILPELSRMLGTARTKDMLPPFENKPGSRLRD